MQMSTYVTFDPSNINEKIYNFLKGRILDLTYPPGHKLDMRQLKDELGVSQTPIKDALFRLAGEGFVAVSSRKGTHVREVNERDVSEIYDIRTMLETGAAEILVGRITDEQLDELGRLYQETLLRDADDDYPVFMERSKEFHRAIIRFTDNRRLLDLYEHLHAHMQIVRFRVGKQPLQKRSTTNQEHEEILSAFKERDPFKAKEAIKYHLQAAKTAIFRKPRKTQHGIKFN